MKIQKSYDINKNSLDKIYFTSVGNNFVKVASKQMTLAANWQTMWTGVGLFHKNRYYGIYKHENIENSWSGKGDGLHYLSGIIGIHLGTVISDNHIHITMVNMSGIFGMVSYDIFADKKKDKK